MKVYLFMAS